MPWKIALSFCVVKKSGLGHLGAKEVDHKGHVLLKCRTAIVAFMALYMVMAYGVVYISVCHLHVYMSIWLSMVRSGLHSYV